MNKTRGRPQKYTDEELLKILEKFSNHNKGNLNFLKLEKATGIKRHVWSRRFGKKIKELNEPYPLMKYTKLTEVPPLNIRQLVETFSNNKNGLIQSFQHFEDQYNKSVKEHIELERKNKKLEEILNRKTEEILKLKDLIKYYEEIVIGSSFPHLRRKHEIKNNLVSINKENKQKALDLKFSHYSDLLE